MTDGNVLLRAYVLADNRIWLYSNIRPMWGTDMRVVDDITRK
jgi:hypothetical protein